MKELISYQEAVELMLESKLRLAEESVALEDSLGRTLASDIIARDDLPPFDNSAMDGYAVLARDALSAGASLSMIEEIPAGTMPSKAVTSGACSQIMTGAVVPTGATAVIPIEKTRREGSTVTLLSEVIDGQHIRKAGEDIAAGDRVASVGDVVTPATIGMMAAAGADRCKVYSRPAVGIVATGDEIVAAGEVLKPGQIRNSNGPALVAQAISAGAIPVGPFVARDSRQSVEDVMSQVEQADIIVFAGGVSVGEYDFVQEALENRGLQTVFWRVRQRPGKPLLFGLLGETPVIGLPGNPVSASVCFEMYVRPLIEASLNIPPAASRHAVLTEKVEKKEGLHYFARGICAQDGTVTTVNLAGPQASNIYSTMVKANCFVHLPEGRAVLDAGSTVEIAPINWPGIA